MTNSTETTTDPRPLFERAVALATEVLDGIAPGQLDDPTPCTGMDVRALRDHVIMVLRRVAAAGRGDELASWPGPEPIADDAVAGAWDEARRQAQAAWADDTVLTRSMDLPWTTLPGAGVLGTYLNEITVHTWDLARATGQSPAFDDEVVDTALVAIHGELPMAERGPLWEAAKQTVAEDYPWEDPFADAVPVGDDAPAIDRLVAWNGRRP